MNETQLVSDLVTRKPWCATIFADIRETLVKDSRSAAAVQQTEDVFKALVVGLQTGNQNGRAEVVRAIVELHSGVWSSAWAYEILNKKLPGVRIIDRFTPETVETPPQGHTKPHRIVTPMRVSDIMDNAGLDRVLAGLFSDPLKLVDEMVRHTNAAGEVAKAAGVTGALERHSYATKPRLHVTVTGGDTIDGCSYMYALGWVRPKT